MNNVQLSNILHIQEASKQDKLVIFVGAGVSTILVFQCGES